MDLYVGARLLQTLGKLAKMEEMNVQEEYHE